MIANPTRHARLPLTLRWCIVVVLLGLPATSHARDMTGKGGVGMLLTTEGMPTLALRYWRTQFALEALVGYAATTPVPARISRPDETNLRVALGLLYRIADAQRASLAIGVRPWMQYTLLSYTISYRANGDAPSEVDDHSWRFGAEIPLHAEVFLNDHFSLSGQVALTVDLGKPVARSDGLTTALDQQNDTTLLLGLRGGFSGGAGATYYF